MAEELKIIERDPEQDYVTCENAQNFTRALFETFSEGDGPLSLGQSQVTKLLSSLSGQTRPKISLFFKDDLIAQFTYHEKGIVISCGEELGIFNFDYDFDKPTELIKLDFVIDEQGLFHELKVDHQGFFDDPKLNKDYLVKGRKYVSETLKKILKILEELKKEQNKDGAQHELKESLEDLVCEIMVKERNQKAMETLDLLRQALRTNKSSEDLIETVLYDSDWGNMKFVTQVSPNSLEFETPAEEKEEEEEEEGRDPKSLALEKRKRGESRRFEIEEDQLVRICENEGQRKYEIESFDEDPNSSEVDLFEDLDYWVKKLIELKQRNDKARQEEEAKARKAREKQEKEEREKQRLREEPRLRKKTSEHPPADPKKTNEETPLLGTNSKKGCCNVL